MSISAAGTIEGMRTLHTAYRVSHLSRSLAFYTDLGFLEVGRVSPRTDLLLVMLRLPDDEVVTLELTHEPGRPLEVGDGFSHIVVQVEDLQATVLGLKANGIEPEPIEVHGTDGPRTAFLTDPDGYRIELVQWPLGHANGITEIDTQPEPEP